MMKPTFVIAYFQYLIVFFLAKRILIDSIFNYVHNQNAFICKKCEAMSCIIINFGIKNT